MIFCKGVVAYCDLLFLRFRVLHDPSQYPLAIKGDDSLRAGDWQLVLPPWGHMPHWAGDDRTIENGLSWSIFFNINALKTFIPVMECNEFGDNGERFHY